MLVRLLGKEAEAKAGTWNIPFSDVADWARPYVGYAYTNGLTDGTSAATYGGTDAVTASQYLTFVLRALGYEAGTDFQWDRAWELSDRIGLTSGQYHAGTAHFVRGDIAIISNSALKMVRKGTNTTLLSTLNLSDQQDKKSTTDTKIEILEYHGSGLEYIAEGSSLIIDGLKHISDGNYSDSYTRAYLIKLFQYDQEYIKLAIDDWNTAVNLCGNYSDTQSMKGYLEQEIEEYSALLDYTITADTVMEYMQYRTTFKSSEELAAAIQAEIDAWVKETIAEKN